MAGAEAEKYGAESALCAELIDASALLANWISKHKTEFPSHTVAVEITCRPEPGPQAFTCEIRVEGTGEQLLYVSQDADSATRAAGEARLGAEVVVAESRGGWT